MTRVLITRPQADAEALQVMLAHTGIDSVIQPLFRIVAGRQLALLADQLDWADTVIAVSKHAVNQAALMNKKWPSSKTYLAVGETTREHWQRHNPNPIFCPSPQTSEGLLLLPQLESINSANILILRGQSGRELLAQVLRQKGSQVQYCECYQRQSIELDGQEQIQHWMQQGISHWIATSEEQLMRVETFCPSSEKNWLHRLQLITVSPRLMKKAQTLGFKHIHLSTDACNTELVAALNLTVQQAN